MNREYLRRYYAAKPYSALLNRTRDALRKAGYSVDDSKAKPAALLHEFNRLAGREWIDPRHPLWASVRVYLADLARDRKPLFQNAEMLEIVTAGQIENTGGSVRRFLVRIEKLIHNRPEKENAPVS